MTTRLRRIAVVLLAVVGLLLAAVVAAFVAGLPIDGSHWRDALAQRASAALGRPVAVQGALQLKLGRELVLRVGELRVLSPPGFTAPEFLTVGDARLRIDLWDAVRGLPRLRSLEAGDIGLWLERAADGRGNWAFAPSREPAARPPSVDLGRITLSRVAIHYDDARTATRRAVVLDELEGSAGSSDAVRLALRGRGAGEEPYRLTLDGGSLRLLQDGSRPWPFRLDLKVAGARLHASGDLDAGRGEAKFHFDAQASDLAEAGRLLGAALPQAGAATLNGFAVARGDAIALSQLQGTLGESAFSGQLALALGGVRPHLAGALSLAVFDLRPFVETRSQQSGNATDVRPPAWQALALRNLLPLDLDLEVAVDQWLGLPIALRETKLGLHADGQGLRAPIRATVGGAVVAGAFDLNTAATTPTLALQLDAKDVAFGSLVRDLAGADGLEGNLGSAGLRLAARGEQLGALLRDVELSLAVASAQASYVQAAGARPLKLSVEALNLVVGHGQPLRGQARASLRGERVRVSLRGGTLPDLLDERATPIELELALAQATLRLRPELTSGAAQGSAVRFDLQARRSGDLARWLPVAAESDLPVALRGRMRVAQDAWQLEDTLLQLGHSQLRIDARRTLVADRPITTATLRSPLIDTAELATLRPRGQPRNNAASRLDAPILADAIELGDADLDLEVQRLRLARTELVDVGLVARTREGQLLPSTLKGQLAGAPFVGRVELDLRGDAPIAKLDLSTGEIDIGALLRGLGLAEDLEGRADSLQVALRGQGNSLRELAANTELDAYLLGGSLSVVGAAQRPVTEIRVREAVIGAAAGQPVRLRLDGTLDHTPVRIKLSTGSFADFAGDATRVPFAMTAQAAGTRLSLDGEVTLPLGSAGRLTLELAGERLDSLSSLARVELPAWGPWSLRGPIRMNSTGYEVQGLTLAVGSSRLEGSGTMDLSGPRPRLQLQVAAPTLQLDDFPMPDRLSEDPTLPPRQAEGLRGTTTRLAGRVDRLLSARFLRRFDASLDLQAGEVLSGADRLANGGLQLKLQDGRLVLDPAVLNLPGGSMRLSMAYDLKESEVDFLVAAYVERFDYGIIARRLNRADDLRGLFSMNLELAGRAPSLDSIMRNANGRLDFAVWPTELRSGMFNLWSANLVLTLLPLIDPGLKSQVNCIVGRFDLKGGDLSDDKFLIDTSTVRIRGTGHANLRSEELGFVFRPRAKGLGLFRLQTPLRVSGTLTDQRFHFDGQDIFFSVLHMMASPILVPIEWFTLGPQPRDGADVCTDPLRATSP